MAHVFLTGDRQVGKSRAVRRAAELTGRPLKGFLTRFLTAERGSSSLYMFSCRGTLSVPSASMALFT